MEPALDVDHSGEGRPGDFIRMAERIHHRTLGALAALSTEGWKAPSRLEGSTVGDVVHELVEACREAHRWLSEPSSRFPPTGVPRGLPERPIEHHTLLNTYAAWARLALDRLSFVPALYRAHVVWDWALWERDALSGLGLTSAPDPEEVRVVASHSLALAGCRLHAVGLQTHVDLSLHGSGAGSVRLGVDDTVTVQWGLPGNGDGRGDALEVAEAIAGRGRLGLYEVLDAPDDVLFVLSVASGHRDR